MKRMSIEERLATNKFAVDEEPHILLDKEVCKACSAKYCLYVCPAQAYKEEEGEIVFDHAGCLECGACRVVCPEADKTFRWNFPKGSLGINFRYG